MGQQRRNDPAKSRSHWEKGKGEKYVETFTITTEYRIVQQNTSLASIETRTTKILHVCARTCQLTSLSDQGFAHVHGCFIFIKRDL
jgi:hypothetical protein